MMDSHKSEENKSKCKQKVRINVGGTIFQCYSNTLMTFENSLLSKLDESCDNFDEKSQEYFFDRSPRIFDFILDAYRTGTLHLPKDVCGINFKTEMEFWGISPNYLSPCCLGALYKSKLDVETIRTLQKCFNNGDQELKTNMLRRKVRDFLHEPKSSVYAKGWAIFLCVAVITSLLLSAVETVQSATESTNHEEQMLHLAELLGWTQNSSYLTTLNMRPHPVTSSLNAVCFVILTSELLLTIAVSSNLSNVLKSWLKISEVFCCIAFWIYFTLGHCGIWKDSFVLVYVYIACKEMLLLRLAWLFRFGKHISALNVLGHTFRSSKDEMHVLGLMLFILTTLFGTCLYLVEATSSNKLRSMFDAMYWALITLTTVGYGDIVPTTPIGRVITCACAMCGILMLVIPVGIVTTSFHYLYEQHKYVTCHTEDKLVTHGIVMKYRQCKDSQA